MNKVTIRETNGNYYDEYGNKLIAIGNANHYNGEQVYTDNGYIFGRVNNGSRPLLYIPQKAEGAPLFVGTDGEQAPARVIPPMYYQEGATYYGDMQSVDFCLSLNFEVVDNTKNIGENANDYYSRGLYNTETAVVKDYAELSMDDDARLVTVVDNEPVLQTGLAKASIGNNKLTIANCEYIIDEEIAPYDRTYSIVSTGTNVDATQDYCYKSIYSSNDMQMGDNSTIYSGDEISTLAVSYKDEVVECAGAITAGKSDLLKTMKDYSTPTDSIAIWPSADVRPQPTPQIVYWGLTDSEGERIDDKLNTDGTLAQYSNLKIQYIGLNPLTVILYIEIVGVCYPYLKYNIYSGEEVQEWVPMLVHANYTIAVTADDCTIIKKNINSKYMSHSIYGEVTTADNGTESISKTDKTKWEKATIYMDNKSYAVKEYKMGGLSDGLDNSAPLKMTVSEEYIINLTDELTYNLSDSKIYFDNNELIEVSEPFVWGCSHYKNDLILLINADVYRIRDGKILKHTLIKLNKDYEAFGICNVNICFSKNLKTISKEV